MSDDKRRVGGRRGLAIAAASILIAAGAATVGIAAAGQPHAPRPGPAQAGTAGSAGPQAAGRGRHPGQGHRPPQAPPSAQPSTPALSAPGSVAIPAIRVHSTLLTVGLTRRGTVQVPPLFSGKAAWYKGSPAPGQIGTSLIEGHVDTYKGPSVFYRLGNLRPGNIVDVTLADGTVTVFRVSSVRQYAKSSFPALSVYGYTDYPSLRLITCGGTFDYATRQYLDSTVAFAKLVSWHS